MSKFTCVLRVLDRGVTVHCEDHVSFELLCACYSAFLTEPIFDQSQGLVCRIALSEDNDGWTLHSEGRQIESRCTADLLYDFEKTMTLWLQRARSELFFTHAAALSIDDRCVVISGASGSGKSSLAWSMCHSGFGYLSDELAPIHPTHLHVEPYPHALCLKTEPLAGPSLPKSAIHTSATMHVPADELQNHAVEHSCPIGAIVFIDSSRNGCSLELDEISPAEAAARLYSNGLNQLAHVDDGLPAAIRITNGVPTFLATGGDVEERSYAIRELL